MADDMEKKGQQSGQPGQGQHGGQSGQHGQGQQTGQPGQYDPKKGNQGKKETDDQENQDRDRQRRAS